MKSIVLAALALVTTMLPCLAQAEWKPVEQEKLYSISGNSGPELYASIGENGPKVVGGLLGAIAHTSFKLTWTRKYEPRDGGCVISVNRPKLIITYVLPRPRGELPASVREEWDVFISGVRAHEKVHGRMIVDMVKEIEAMSVGLTVADDPNCKKIRQVLTGRLAQISQNQRQKSRDFDQVELTEGGNIHQLILRLVNGS